MFANGRPRAIVDYGADPRERFASSLFGMLWRTVQGAYTAPYLPGDDNPNGGTFNGLHKPVQAFMGADFLAANPVQYPNGGYPMIDSGLIEGPMGDPARKIFADRLRRRGGLQ